jgi:hypothetical protein
LILPKINKKTEKLVYPQDPEATAILNIATPAICCMESLSVLESDVILSHFTKVIK